MQGAEGWDAAAPREEERGRRVSVWPKGGGGPADEVTGFNECRTTALPPGPEGRKGQGEIRVRHPRGRRRGGAADPIGPREEERAGRSCETGGRIERVLAPRLFRGPRRGMGPVWSYLP